MLASLYSAAMAVVVLAGVSLAAAAIVMAIEIGDRHRHV